MENPDFIFSSGPVELKEEGENFFVEGHISTSDLDLVNDIVTKDCIMDMAEQMRERTIKLDVEHESFKGSTNLEMEINKTIIPAAKIDDFLVDKKGLKIRAVLNKHVGRFNEIKNSIKEGFLDAFSIAFIPVESKTDMREGKEVRMLDKINLLNVAFTGNPVNTNTTMTNVFAKSLEFLKDKEKNHNHSSNDAIKLQEVKQMTEEDKKEEDQSESEEESKEESGSESESEGKAKKKPEEDEEEEKKKKVSKKDEEPREKEESESEESKEESAEESKEESGSEETEKKSLKELQKDMTEVKAALKRPMLKSKIDQEDKSKNFAEEKALNPLDVIA